MTRETTSNLFGVAQAFRAAYPGACAGALAMRDVANPPEHAALDARKLALEQQLRARFAGYTREDFKALSAVQAYNAYYRRFDKTYHVQLQIESLVLKGKPIPRVAALVEAMFMAELQNQLLTAGHDQDAMQGGVRVDVATGNERYVALSGQEQTLKAGDMYMADAQGVISSVLYGPDQRTRITPATRKVLFTVYAPAGIGAEAVHQHLCDIRDHVQVVVPEAAVELLSAYV
jgi:DNA/RNA-binding domain of Phe-tRNA-synthetase-like protein